MEREERQRRGFSDAGAGGAFVIGGGEPSFTGWYLRTLKVVHDRHVCVGTSFPCRRKTKVQSHRGGGSDCPCVRGGQHQASCGWSGASRGAATGHRGRRGSRRPYSWGRGCRDFDIERSRVGAGGGFSAQECQHQMEALTGITLAAVLSRLQGASGEGSMTVTMKAWFLPPRNLTRWQR